MTSNDRGQDGVMSIGAVSRATGIAVETLRTWERRYGFPVPARTDGGHRKYPAGVVEQLLLIQAALDRGMRPSNVVGAPSEALRNLLDLTPELTPAPTSPEEAACAPSALKSAELSGWMAAVQRMDADAFWRELERGWFQHTTTEFLHERVGPLLEEIGRAWYEGRITVLHEQFASNQLRKFLSSHWRPISERARGPRVLCATLPGEFHAIGLHMTAVVMALAGCQIIFLGCDMPMDAIARAADEHSARATLISVSAAADTPTVRTQLKALRALLPEGHSLLVGGSGAPHDVDGVTWIASLPELERWAKQTCLEL
jgi:DNA-binding transcriptional MerR regulator/methylmalonyl-CoA mutase cobalamin-binding subunit